MQCHRWLEKEINPITGTSTIKNYGPKYCKTSRQFALDFHCGINGKYWEPKEKKWYEKIFTW
jgi:hypothetical protein